MMEMLLAFSLIIAVQFLIANSLDNWLKKSYNTTTLGELKLREVTT
jgi:hypothetical protein